MIDSIPSTHGRGLPLHALTALIIALLACIYYYWTHTQVSDMVL